MSENETRRLDSDWDEFQNTGQASDPAIASVHAHGAAENPDHQFVQGLRKKLLHEATAAHSSPNPWSLAPEKSLSAAVQPLSPGTKQSPPRRQRPILRWTSLIAVAVLLLTLAASLDRLTGRNDSGTTLYAPTQVASPESAIQFPDVPMTGANNARTNQQPGPAPVGVPAIARRSATTGVGLVLASNKLLVVNPFKSEIEAIDATTLNQIWAVPLERGAYLTPTVSGDTFFMGYTENSEGGHQNVSGNALIAYSLGDGHELWRTAGAAMAGSQIAVDGDRVYSVGVGKNGDTGVLGAYRIDDGSAIWQATIEQELYCCGGPYLALTANTIVVTLPNTMFAFRQADGSPMWNRSAHVGEFFAPASIVGSSVHLMSGAIESDSAQQSSRVVSARIETVGLSDGKRISEQDKLGAYQAALAGIENADDYVVSGFALPDSTLTIARFPNGSEDPMWRLDASTLPSTLATYEDILVGPTTVGNTIFQVLSVPNDGSGNIGQSVLLSIDGTTGVMNWAVQLTGTIAVSPIVSGGKIFLLTSDSGLYQLAVAPPSVATPSASPEASPAVSDFRMTVTCNAVAVPNPLLGNLPSTPTIAGFAPLKSSMTTDQIPSGTGPVDAATAAAINKRFDDYRGCSDLDPYNGVFGFFSTDFYVRLTIYGIEGGKEQPWAIWMAPMVNRLQLDTSTLQTLPDGRTGGIVRGTWGDKYVWFVQENGAWVIDEYQVINPILPTNTPVPTLPPRPVATP